MKLFDVYNRLDVNIVRGEGCQVWDDQGQPYLDMYGGHAVISIGHSHPHYVQQLTEQLGRLGFYSNAVQNSLQQQLADRLGRISGYDDYQLFLVNSGAEANENALKLASFANRKRQVVLAARRSFHGRTSLAVEMTNNPKIVAPINDNHHAKFLPINDLTPWMRELDKENVLAVIVEPIQGVGGVQMMTPEFAQSLEYFTHRHGALLICDEVQCGYGRSGKFFAHQWLGIKPDIITVAKGIANGFPMGGVLISPKFTAEYGMLGTTFGGNHLACTAALSVLDVMEQEHLIENADAVGTYLMQKLLALKSEEPKIVDVRGRGLMIGVELDVPQKPVHSRLVHEQHVFVGTSGDFTLRLLPPLTLTKAQADDFVERLQLALSD